MNQQPIERVKTAAQLTADRPHNPGAPGSHASEPERRQPHGAAARQPAAARQLTGDFADVDASDQLAELSGYLERVTQALAVAKRQTIAALDLQAGERVLDVGCGTGDDVALIANRVGRRGEAVGLDASRRLIQQARQRHGHLPNARFVIGDAHQLPFEADTFAAARAERVLMHVADPARVIAEMARAVAPGGRVAAFEPDWDTLIIDADPLADTRAITRVWSDHVAHGTIGRQLARLLADASLSAIEVTPISTVLRELPTAESLLELSATAAAALEPHAADAWLDGLRERAAAGRFLATVTSVHAVGHKPVARR